MGSNRGPGWPRQNVIDLAGGNRSLISMLNVDTCAFHEPTCLVEMRTQVMSDTKIERAAVDGAVASALDALANESGLDWVRKSALIERAYYWGVYFGLRSVANEDDLKALVLKMFQQTMWAREAEDTFGSTTIGRDWAALLSALEPYKAVSCDDAKEIIAKLRSNIDEEDRRWRGFVEQAYQVLHEIFNVVNDSREDATRRRAIEHLAPLEDCLRRIALQESDHSIGKRLE